MTKSKYQINAEINIIHSNDEKKKKPVSPTNFIVFEKIRYRNKTKNKNFNYVLYNWQVSQVFVKVKLQ